MDCLVSLVIDKRKLDGYFTYNIKGLHVNHIQNPKVLEGETIEEIRAKLHVLINYICDSYER